jgi:tRNA(Ile)-lysidine synthase
MTIPAPPAPALVARFHRDLLALTGAAPDHERRLGLAVSGGPDSLALLLLGHAAFPSLVVAATVDHGLRPEAADEARFVGAVCAALGVPHTILTNDGQIPLDGLRSTQERARALRYGLLRGWRAALGATHIAIAHHRDDRAETFLMRAARGAGIAGLSGMRAISSQDPAIIRPLLDWPRATLHAIVGESGLQPVDDPSNRDPRYDRTRIRALLGENPALPADRLAHAATVLAEADEALAWAAERAWRERASRTSNTIRLELADLPRELRRRLLARGLAEMNDTARPPRGDAVDRLLILLDSGRPGTLAGLVVRPAPGPVWRIAMAPPRRAA